MTRDDAVRYIRAMLQVARENGDKYVVVGADALDQALLGVSPQPIDPHADLERRVDALQARVDPMDRPVTRRDLLHAIAAVSDETNRYANARPSSSVPYLYGMTNAISRLRKRWTRTTPGGPTAGTSPSPEG